MVIVTISASRGLLGRESTRPVHVDHIFTDAEWSMPIEEFLATRGRALIEEVRAALATAKAEGTTLSAASGPTTVKVGEIDPSLPVLLIDPEPAHVQCVLCGFECLNLYELAVHGRASHPTETYLGYYPLQ